MVGSIVISFIHYKPVVMKIKIIIFFIIVVSYTIACTKATDFVADNSLPTGIGSYPVSSNALTDKASCAAMMSFINMLTATLAVVIMGYLGNNPMKAFVEILAGMWILIVTLLISINIPDD